MGDYNPQPKTIEKMVSYLESLGLSVYGRNIDLDTGEQLMACMDYDAEDILKLREHIKKDTLWEMDE